MELLELLLATTIVLFLVSVATCALSKWDEGVKAGGEMELVPEKDIPHLPKFD